MDGNEPRYCDYYYCPKHGELVDYETYYLRMQDVSMRKRDEDKCGS